MEGTGIVPAPQVPVLEDTAYLHATFDAGGYLSRINARYAPRDQQFELATHAHNAFSQSVPTFAQGPCGTGKGLAYLVPGIRHAIVTESRLVVATASNALLEQLMRGELPMLRSALPWKFTFAEYKGRANYLCVDKIAHHTPSMLDPEQLISARDLLRWSRETKTGNKDEAPPNAEHAWRFLSVGPDDCKKPHCKFEKECFSERARRQARDATVVVTNHHMLSLDLKHGMVLPEYKYLAIDEAHEFADIARKFFGESISPNQFKKLAKSTHDTQFRDDVESFYSALRAYMENPLDSELGESTGGRQVEIKELPGDPTMISRLEARIRRVVEEDGEILRTAREAKEAGLSAPVHREDLANATMRARLAQKVQRVLWPADPECVRWFDTKEGPSILNVQPVRVAGTLNKALFERNPATFVTSATLTVDHSFAFVNSELGTPKSAQQHVVGSPFDFPKQAMLYIPEIPAPDEDEEGWAQGVLRTLAFLVRSLDGRTMGLFTAHARAQRAYEYLRRIEGEKRKVYVQGQGSTRSLVDAFTADERSVLVGTQSMGTGVNAPGDTLCALLIDKLPMGQDTPQTKAIRASMKAEKWVDEKGKQRVGRDFFSQFYIPKSAITLEQWFGRLIRSLSDIGVCVICDTRILTKPYGKTFMNSLPSGMFLTRDPKQIVPFLIHAKESVGKVKAT